MTRAAGITSNTVPWEILRAAGFSPRLLDADPGLTPYADLYMEPVFDRRFRAIFEGLCSGAWGDLGTVVVSRASEQEHKLYLYLREVARERGASIPSLYLYNLLHTRTPESYDYGLERTRQMARDFEVTEEALAEAIVESNHARSVVREIQAKRDQGLLEGSAAIAMISQFYTVDRRVFAQNASAQLQALQEVVHGGRPRILIKSAPLDSAGLHRVVEQAGGYVVAEDDWRGSRAGGAQDVRTDVDPIPAVFEKYFSDEVSPRLQPREQRDAWFHGVITSGIADAVLFHIPLEDDVVGWDYPQQLAWLQKRNVPSFVVREPGPSSELDRFLQGLGRR